MTIHEKGKALRVWAALTTRGLFFGLVVASAFAQSTAAAETMASLSISDPAGVSRAHASALAESQPATGRQPGRANFEQELASQASRDMADWVVDSAITASSLS